MFNFFVDDTARVNGGYNISGNDYNHIVNVLRMNVGERFLVSFEGRSDLCEIETLEEQSVFAKIVEENYQNTELPLEIFLFQGLPKGDKMEFIIQKTVELGVDTIVPTEMSHCVVKLDDKKKKSKTARWQAIAESAAKQSKRNNIPTVLGALSYKKALEIASELDLLLVPYENENGMLATKEALQKLSGVKTVGIIIGPEGGFSDSEIDLAKEMGGIAVSLGKRILRTETAAVTSVAMCMLAIEMNDKES